MKIRLYLKDPDGVYEALVDAAEAELELSPSDGLSSQIRKDMLQCKVGELMKVVTGWVEYGEYVKIEIDTEAKTAIVVPV
jgi:hypothetical protein